MQNWQVLIITASQSHRDKHMLFTEGTFQESGYNSVLKQWRKINAAILFVVVVSVYKWDNII